MPGMLALGLLANLTLNYAPLEGGPVLEMPGSFRLGWIVPPRPGRAAGVLPSAHRVLLSAADGALLWDSGIRRTNATALTYPGQPALARDAEYSVRVLTNLTDGSALRADGRFATGLFSRARSGWDGAQWVSGDRQLSAQRRNNLRASWQLPAGRIGGGSAFVVGIGYHELYCNGARQGRPGAKLQPGNSHFEKRSYVIRYDLSRCLRAGKNVLAVVLGNGWFSQGAPESEGRQTPGASQMPGARPLPPQLLLRARATVDGRPQLLVSNGSWEAAIGPILEDSLYNGEVYDARLELSDRRGRRFSHPEYEPAQGLWAPVSVGTGGLPESALLTMQNFPPIQKIRRLAAKSISPAGSADWVVDFGQNTAGIVQVKLGDGFKRGENITIRHAEVMMHQPYGPASGQIFTGNLRSALARDVYIFSGVEPNGSHWEPTFAQHGFRYIQVSGLKRRPSVDDFVSLEMRTAVTETGSFECSSELINRIQSNCQWTARSNLMSIPTDCPQRNERRGWMGDAALGASVNLYNHEMHAFYSGFLNLITDEQPEHGDDAGALPNWVPAFPTQSAFAPGAPNWKTAFPTILYTVWKHTGDDELVRRHWGRLRSYLGWYERRLAKTPSFGQDPFNRDASGQLTTAQPPGDWCPPPAKPGLFRDPSMNLSADIRSGLGEAECGAVGWNKAHSRYTNASLFTDKRLASAYAYLNDVRQIAEMGRAVGAPNGSAIAGITDALRTNFRQSFFSGSYFGSGGAAVQTENAMPLLLGLVDPEEQPKLLQLLLHDIVDKHSNHSTSGIVGLRVVLDVLTKLGHADVALSVRSVCGGLSRGVDDVTERLSFVWISTDQLARACHHCMGSV